MYSMDIKMLKTSTLPHSIPDQWTSMWRGQVQTQLPPRTSCGVSDLTLWCLSFQMLTLTSETVVNVT